MTKMKACRCLSCKNMFECACDNSSVNNVPDEMNRSAQQMFVSLHSMTALNLNAEIGA